MKKFAKQIVAGFLALSMALSGHAADTAYTGKNAKQLSQAQSLIQAGQFKEAYNLLQPLEFEQAGNLQYDYLLGISAVNAGRPDRAVIALERITAVRPNYGDTRQWLAIAYFQSGDMVRAKKEFNAVLAQKPSVQVKTNVDQYLAAIKQQEDASGMQHSFLLGNVELGYGHDSSIATVPDAYASAYYASIGASAPPDKPTIPSGISDNFSQLNLNIEGRVPFSSAGTYGFLSVDSNNRSYHNHSMMNSRTNLAKGGVNVTSRGDTYRFDVARRSYHQEGTEAGYTNDSSQNSVTGDARFMMTERDYWALDLQYNTPRYSTTPDQDTNQTVLSTNFMHIFAHEGTPLVYFALNYARDRAIRDATKTLTDTSVVTTTNVSRNTKSFTFYTQYSFIKDADVLAMWTKSYRTDSTAYGRAYVSTLPYGRDAMSIVMLGLNWRPAPNWIVHPQWMRITNDSNIPLYGFQKTEFSVSLKREFK